MSFISKPVTDSNFGQILNQEVISTTPLAPLTIPIFSHRLEFFQKWKMSFFSKIVRDRAISGKFWIPRVPRTTLGHGKYSLSQKPSEIERF